MNAKTSLQAVVSHAESSRPAFVQALPRPPAIAHATELAFLRFETPGLDAAERFQTDFGLQTVARNAEQLVMRGAGTAPCIYVATRGAVARYVGAAFVIRNDVDFARLVRESGAQPLAPASIPGGGRGVELVDPAGFAVWLLVDRPKVLPLRLRAAFGAGTNTPGYKGRVNTAVRTPLEPATVVRIGHMVLQTTRFAALADWYMRHLGLVPSDVQYLADGSPALAFFRLDLGSTPTDHHSFVLVGALEDKFEHSAYEVPDLDALGQGQQVLRARGHRHLWGLGRHVLGSQLFDYWLDPDGVQFEHFSDGDAFTADHETHYSEFSLASIWAWGHDVPRAMRPRKNLALLWRVLRLLVSKRLALSRLKLLGGALAAPARPWL